MEIYHPLFESIYNAINAINDTLEYYVQF